MSGEQRRQRPSRKVRMLRAGSIAVGLATAVAIGAVSAGGASAVSIPRCPITVVNGDTATTAQTGPTGVCFGGGETLGVRWQ